MMPTHEPDTLFRQAILGAVAVHLLALGVVLPTRPAPPPSEPEKPVPHWIIRWTPSVEDPEPPPPRAPSQRARRLVLPDRDPDHDPEPVRAVERVEAPDATALAPGAPIFGRPQGPPPPEPLRVGTSGIEPPRKIRHVVPDYPLPARKLGLEGLVVLDLLLDETGRVAEVEVVRARHPGLTEAAVEAVRGWIYEPARLDGRPVPVHMTVRVRFELD